MDRGNWIILGICAILTAVIYVVLAKGLAKNPPVQLQANCETVATHLVPNLGWCGPDCKTVTMRVQQKCEDGTMQTASSVVKFNTKILLWEAH